MEHTTLTPAILQLADGPVVQFAYVLPDVLEALQPGTTLFYDAGQEQFVLEAPEGAAPQYTVKKIAEDAESHRFLLLTVWEGESPLAPIRHPLHFLSELEQLIAMRHKHPTEKSYTSQLFAKGINKIAQKVGEEAVEVVIEAKDDNEGLFQNEVADLIYHLMVLLRAKGQRVEDIVAVLAERHK